MNPQVTMKDLCWLALKRAELLMCQANLSYARACGGSMVSWETHVKIALDRVWEAQERCRDHGFKAIKVGDIITGAGLPAGGSQIISMGRDS